MDYWMTVLTFAAIYAGLALACNIAVGYVGMLSIAFAALFGVGAYTYALVSTKLWTDGNLFLLAVVGAFAVTALVGVFLCIFMLWLPVEYVVLITFAVQLIATQLLFVASGITNGALGIAGIPIPKILGWEVDTVSDQFVLAVAMLAIVLAVSSFALRPSLGLRARAVRDDPVAAEGLGISVKLTSAVFFALSAGLAGVAGAVYAAVTMYVDPVSFTIHVSVLVLSMVVLGGLGNPYGAVLGALVISLLPQLLRQLSLDSGSAAVLQQIIYGFALIIIMIVRPVGLMPERTVLSAPRERTLLRSVGGSR